MEELKPQRRNQAITDNLPPAIEQPMLDRLGDFQILREIGRGGMGIVYEAVQEALGRRVAIKVLPAHLLINEKLRERFRREAHAAARLHHTNIVPVFGVGEQDGLCYYVMQLIAGQGLDVVLRESAANKSASRKHQSGKDDTLPQSEASLSGTHNLELVDAAQLESGFVSSFRLPCFRDAAFAQYAQTVAQIGLQVAEALDYSHNQGVLHRDIKPSNLLLEDETVWVTDFGIAKVTEEGNLTQTGDLVGTLKYMAPERFRGDSDARSDVYSLGLTLYEMLAQRPAFPDTAPQQLIHLITHEEPPRLRKLNPKIPADLETLILKAIARDPAHRYQTAREMASDLRRFLEDRPIKARRATSVERVWRWCRRNRLAASLGATVFSLLILVAVVFAIGYLQTAAANREVKMALAAEQKQREQTDAANRRVEKALHAEKKQREQAEGTASLALEALDQIYDRFAPNRITVTSELPVDGTDRESIEVPIQPVLSKEAAPLLEEMLVFYERLAKQSGDYPNLRAQAAEANHRIADIRQRLGQFHQAGTAYQRAIELYRKLQKDVPDDARILVMLARCYNESGRVHRALQEMEEERKAHTNAQAILTETPANLAKRPEYRYELARTQYFLARQGGPPVASGQGRPSRPRPMRGDPGGPGRPSSPGGRRPRNPVQGAIDILEGLVKEYPTVRDYRHLLACCYRDVPPERSSRDRGPTAGSSSKAVEILEKLVLDFPQVPDYRYDLSETYAKIDVRRLYFAPQQAGEVEKQLQKALTISKDLVAEYPHAPDYAASHAQIHHKLGVVSHQRKELDEAEKKLRKAVSLQTDLCKRYPDSSINSFWQTVMQTSLARVLSDRKQWQEARTVLETAVNRQKELVEKDRRLWFIRGQLSFSYRMLAEALTNLGEKEAAADASAKAEQYRGERPSGFPGSRERR